MTSKSVRVLFFIAVSAFLIYIALFIFLHNDKEKRIAEILDQKMQNLQIHYALSEKYFHDIADIAVSPEIIQKNLFTTSNIHSHFLVHRSLLKARAWERKHGVKNYLPSIENEEYVMFIDPHTKQQCSIQPQAHIVSFIKAKREFIKEQMRRHQKFSLYTLINDNAVVISFLPIQNIEGNTVAYLILTSIPKRCIKYSLTFTSSMPSLYL